MQSYSSVWWISTMERFRNGRLFSNNVCLAKCYVKNCCYCIKTAMMRIRFLHLTSLMVATPMCEVSKFKTKATSCTSLRLILSGDIETNPGPGQRISCNNCEMSIRKNVRLPSLSRFYTWHMSQHIPLENCPKAESMDLQSLFFCWIAIPQHKRISRFHQQWEPELFHTLRASNCRKVEPVSSAFFCR